MRNRTHRLLTTTIASAFLFVPTLTATASASPSVSEYSLPSSQYYPYGITTGPDGALWFTLVNPSNQHDSYIGRISTSGAIVEYPIPVLSGEGGSLSITTGSDGALWFTDSAYIGRITTSGTITQYPLPSGSVAYNIAAGSDGALWFTEDGPGRIGRITTSGGVTEYTIPGYSPQPLGIAAGSDGALWFTEWGDMYGAHVGRITTSGIHTEYSLPASDAPYNITAGPDGALWSTDNNSGVIEIDRITTSGAVTEYPYSDGSYAYKVAAGPDGALWFTEPGATKIGRLSLAPSAPTNLTASSPVQNPALSWDAVPDATSYNVYRDGARIDSTTNTTYTDSSASEGTHTYYATAVSDGGESGPSNNVDVLVDRTRPVVTVTPVAGSALSGTETFDITVTDNNPLDSNKNKSDWVYLYDTAGAQKHWGAKVDLSSGSGAFTIDTTQLDNGNANLDVGIVYDAAGNASGTSDNYFRNYTIDN